MYIDNLAQYLYGGILVTEEKLSVGLVNRVVDCEEGYCSSTNTLFVGFDILKNDYNDLYKQFDKDEFSSNLFYSYIQRLYSPY